MCDELAVGTFVCDTEQYCEIVLLPPGMGETDETETVTLLLGQPVFPKGCKLLAAALQDGTAGAASPAHHHVEGILVSQPLVVLLDLHSF